MKLRRGSALEDVALAVAAALGSVGVRAVLTGGACAGIHTKGLYTSSDLDFVLLRGQDRSVVENAVGRLGFVRRGNSYIHSEVEFVIEFLPGPLAIGSDANIRPVVLRLPGGNLTALSSTDSCRDRLAAWFHWKDVQSLNIAVLIAATRRVDRKKIETWSRNEGQVKAWKQFEQKVAARRGGLRTSGSKASKV